LLYLALAYAIFSPSLPILRELHLTSSGSECHNHSFYAGSLLNPDTGVDDLSVALQKIGQLSTIKSLKLTGSFILSSEFFYSINLDTDSFPTSWPSLEILGLGLSSMTPAGDWYFIGDPRSTELYDERSYISDEEDVDSSNFEVEDYPTVSDWVMLSGERPYSPWRNQPKTSTFNFFLLKLAKPVSPQLVNS